MSNSRIPKVFPSEKLCRMHQVATKNSPELGSVSVEVSNYVRRMTSANNGNYCSTFVNIEWQQLRDCNLAMFCDGFLSHCGCFHLPSACMNYLHY